MTAQAFVRYVFVVYIIAIGALVLGGDTFAVIVAQVSMSLGLLVMRVRTMRHERSARE